MIPYLKSLKIHTFDITGYIKVSKEVHTLIRKTGCWYDGTCLSNDQRCGYQYI